MLSHLLLTHCRYFHCCREYNFFLININFVLQIHISLGRFSLFKIHNVYFCTYILLISRVKKQSYERFTGGRRPFFSDAARFGWVITFTDNTCSARHTWQMHGQRKGSSATPTHVSGTDVLKVLFDEILSDYDVLQTLRKKLYPQELSDKLDLLTAKTEQLYKVTEQKQTV